MRDRSEEEGRRTEQSKAMVRGGEEQVRGVHRRAIEVWRIVERWMKGEDSSVEGRGTSLSTLYTVPDTECASCVQVHHRELTAPVGGSAQGPSTRRRLVASVGFGLLGAMLIVALVQIGTDHKVRRTSLGEMYAEAGASGQRGSVATNEAEASHIIPESNLQYDEHMGFPWEQGLERRGVTDPREVADSIIDYADAGNADHTGANGNKLRMYETAEDDSTLARPDMIVGACPSTRHAAPP